MEDEHGRTFGSLGIFCFYLSHFLIGRDCCFPICSLGMFSAQGSQRTLLLLLLLQMQLVRAARLPREHHGRGSRWTFKTSHLKKTMSISCQTHFLIRHFCGNIFLIGTRLLFSHMFSWDVQCPRLPADVVAVVAVANAAGSERLGCPENITDAVPDGPSKPSHLKKNNVHIMPNSFSNHRHFCGNIFLIGTRLLFSHMFSWDVQCPRLPQRTLLLLLLLQMQLVPSGSVAQRTSRTRFQMDLPNIAF